MPKRILLPTQDLTKISQQKRTKSPEIVQFVFKKCPNCSNYSFKPNTNLNTIYNVYQVKKITAEVGRICRICNYINNNARE